MTGVQAILVLNAGSSSLKFKIFAVEGGTPEPLAAGQIDGIGGDPAIRATGPDGGEVRRSYTRADLPDLPAATAEMRRWLDGFGALDLVAVGHRIVHGGADFAGPTLVDPAVTERLAALEPLAPLHQPHNLATLHLAAGFAPGVPQVACFDTAFHRGRPEVAETYALPRAFYERGIRRYGFHGISYEYVAGRLRDVAPEVADGRVIVAHLGNGASMCAIRAGRSIETTMGFTALDGLPMGTRTGEIDPGVLLHLLEAESMSPAELGDLLYRRSGLKGLSGVSNDMRALLASEAPAAAFAIDHFVHRCGLHAGMLAAALGGLDAFVFTAGIGEHAAPVRGRIAERLAWLGAELDPAANAAGTLRISRPDSRVALLVVPTDEELTIARHALALVGGSAHAA